MLGQNSANKSIHGLFEKKSLFVIAHARSGTQIHIHLLNITCHLFVSKVHSLAEYYRVTYLSARRILSFLMQLTSSRKRTAAEYSLAVNEIVSLSLHEDAS
jgi:hypothetical protein